MNTRSPSNTGVVALTPLAVFQGESQSSRPSWMSTAARPVPWKLSTAGRPSIGIRTMAA